MAARQLRKYTQIFPTGEPPGNPAERDRLIREYAPLVKTIAGRLGARLPSHVNQDDLLSAGIMGLLDAIDKFDVEKGVEFKSYAEFRIRGAMLDELRSMDWVPRSVRKNAKRLQEAYTRVEKEKMRPAEDGEVAAELDMDLEQFYRLVDETKGVTVLSREELGDVIGMQDLGERSSMARSNVGLDPMDSLNLQEVRDVLAKGIERLPENERMVVTLYYYEELTMKEIGRVMGYTESRVSQLHTKAVLRMRGTLRSYFEG
ncbi:MAG: FliA/WhiG family RNA polymerase sigma factor [Deltaproteobacteria bacterium]|nr:FliA/WhiG family RNA polymerase sigma factor [Deltaproteobacteria bacterium]